MLIFFILMCSFLYIISSRLFDNKVALTTLLFLIFIPNIFTLSLNVLGEIPASLYFILGIYFLIKNESDTEKKHLYLYCSLSGGFLALSVLSKLIFVILIFPLILYMIINRDKLNTKLVLSSSFLLILFFWEIYQMATLGIEKYSNLKIESYYASIIQGASTEFISIDMFMKKIVLLSSIFGIGKEIVVIILISFTIYSMYLFLYGIKTRKGPLAMYVSFILLSMIAWFFFINRISFKHVLPYIILGAPLLAHLVLKLFGRFTKSKGLRRWITCLILAFLLMSMLISASHVIKQNITDYEYHSSTLKIQKRFIQEIKTIPNELTIGYWGWWKAPEISYFVKNDFVDLSGLDSFGHFKRGNVSSEFVIVAPYQIARDKKSLENLSLFLGSVVFKECDINGECYFLYKYRSPK